MIESISSVPRGRAPVLLVLLAATALHGSVVAGSVPGTNVLQALVRHSTGTAGGTIVDDRARAAWVPPIVSTTPRVVLGHVVPGRRSRGSDEVWMQVNASAVTGTSVTSARIFVQYAEGIEDSYEAPVNGEFFYWESSVYIGGFLIPYTSDAPAPPYRLVVTDSHGLVTEITGPNP